jgi:hypothetical protein
MNEMRKHHIVVTINEFLPRLERELHACRSRLCRYAEDISPSTDQRLPKLRIDLEPWFSRGLTHQNKVRLTMPAKDSGGQLRYGSFRCFRLFWVSNTTSSNILNTMAQMNVYAMPPGWPRNKSVRACAMSSKEENPRYTITIAGGRTDSHLSTTIRTDVVAAATNPSAAAGTAADVRLCENRTHNASKATWQPIKHNNKALNIYQLLF